MRRATLLLLFFVAGCGSRSSLTAAENADASGGGAGGPTGSAGAGAVGQGGAGGAGTGGAGGNPPQISVLDACLIAVSCGRDAGWYQSDVGYCLDMFSRLGWSFMSPGYLPDPTLAARILACAAEAGSECEAFRACYGGDWVSLHRCREGAYCDGNSLTAGPDGPSFDCGVLGATCADLWSGAQRACCNAEPCPQSSGFECEGTVATACGGWGEHVAFDCGESGRTCQSDPEQPCLGTGQVCDVETSTVSCSGSVATYCSGGKLATLDCAATGYRTACNLGAVWYADVCTTKGMECGAWGNDSGACNGTVLEACIDGELAGVDCASVGFSGCDDSGEVTRCTE